MKAEESSPGGKCKRKGNLLCICLLSPGHASEWQTCVSVPLLRNPLQVVRHQGLGCGGCIFLFIIDDPDPDRQHTTHVIWIHSWFQMHALVWTWLWAIIVCGEGMVYVRACVSVCASVCMWLCVCDIGCCSQKCNGPTLCFPAPVWLVFLTANSWFSNFLVFEILIWFLTSCSLFCTFLVAVHLHSK